MSDFQRETFDLTTLFNQKAAEELVKEANAFATLPSGKYRFTTASVEGRIQPPARSESIRAKTPQWIIDGGAKIVHLGVDAVGAGRKGRLFFDISPETLRKQDAKLDTPSRLWGQYEKALGVEGKSAGEVLEAIKAYPVDGYVTESFLTPEGYRTPKTDAEREGYVKAGFEARNFVQSVSAAK